MKGYLSAKKWMTVLWGHVQMTSQDYIKLHKKLKHFEVVLVLILKGSKNASIML